MKIYLNSNFAFDLVIEKETGVSKILEKVGMDTETPLGRAIIPKSFNAQYQITGKPEDKIKEFLSKKEVIEEIKLVEPLIRLTIKKTIIFSKHRVDTANDFKTSRMIEIIKSLYNLSELT